MMSFSKFICLAVVFVSVVMGAITLDGEVLVLDDSNFQEALTANELLLVEFYAPWCGHCKSLAPEWAKAAVTAKDLPIKLAKVDATEAKGLAEQFKIQGFPTIKYFKSGTPSEYDGGRTEKDIVNWIKKKSGPSTVTVNSESDLLKLQEENEAFSLGVFSGDLATSENAVAYAKYASVSKLENVFAFTNSDAIRTKLGLTDDAIVVLKQFDDKREDLAISGKFNPLALEKFIEKASTPLVQDFTQEKSKKIFSSGIKKHALLFLDKDTDTTTLDLFRPVAQEHKGDLLFITVGADQSGILNYFGLTKELLPTLIVADMSATIKKFPIPAGTLSTESMSAHVAAFKAGSLKPHLKSEEYDAEDIANPVKVVKGKSFHDIVMNNNKDVLFEIYAPWCGHCKKLAPVYDEVAEHFAGVNSNIVLAKMDGTANEIDFEGIDVKGFPTLYFIPGNTKVPVLYQGGREKDDFISYLTTHATGGDAAATKGTDEL